MPSPSYVVYIVRHEMPHANASSGYGDIIHVPRTPLVRAVDEAEFRLRNRFNSFVGWNEQSDWFGARRNTIYTMIDRHVAAIGGALMSWTMAQRVYAGNGYRFYFSYAYMYRADRADPQIPQRAAFGDWQPTINNMTPPPEDLIWDGRYIWPEPTASPLRTAQRRRGSDDHQPSDGSLLARIYVGRDAKWIGE